MKLPGLLRPVLDAFAPEDPGAPGRRIRNTAIWLAIASWLLPAYAPLGTATVTHRAILCVAFVAAAVTAHFRARHVWARKGLAVAAVAVALLVLAFSGRSLWGAAFAVFAAIVVGASELRRRHVEFPDPPEDPDPRPPLPRLVPRILAGYGWFVSSVLLVTTWSGQLMMVPTASMQPTIMGARPLTKTSPFSNFVGLVTFTPPNVTSGDYLFVDNFSYLFRDPRRFEIVVFRFPLFRERYFVKRVIGLPGEHVEIKGGDIWIDGKIAKKPSIVQHTMWQEFFPRASVGARTKPLMEGFQGDDSELKRVSDTEMLLKPRAKEAFALCIAKPERGFESHDLRVAFTAVPEAGAVVIARITTRGVPVRFRLDEGENGSGSLTIGRGDEQVVGGIGARAGADVRVELCVADGETWATVDGREVVRAALPAASGIERRVEVGAAKAPVKLRDVIVARDIEYRTGDGRPSVYDVPKDGFFFLGDNVAKSDDSRAWAADVIRTKDREFRAPVRLLTEMGEPGPPNMRQDGANWVFTDVDGVLRTVPREGTTIDSAPAPFARREHLVGRAIMILFPWTVAEAGFRPRLLP